MTSNVHDEKIWQYVYVLFSLKDRKFCSGYTENLKARFEEHMNGRVESTRERRPLKLIYSEACLARRDVIYREKYFKVYHGKQFLRRRLKSYLTG
jgi:putative endonuclease